MDIYTPKFTVMLLLTRLSPRFSKERLSCANVWGRGCSNRWTKWTNVRCHCCGHNLQRDCTIQVWQQQYQKRFSRIHVSMDAWHWFCTTVMNQFRDLCYFQHTILLHL